MPIVSRQLDYARLQANGTVMVRESAVDSLGRHWVHGPRRVASQAIAEADMNARDWTEQLQDVEEYEAVKAIEIGADPATLVHTDLTAAQFNRRMAVRFAKAGVGRKRKFLCGIASWVADLSAGQISSALGISGARAAAIRNRAITLRDTICPALSTDDNQIDSEVS